MSELGAARYFHAVAVDYDGTLAHHDRPDPQVLRALAELRDAGVRVLLVTGRILADLRAVFDDVFDHIDLVVAENGAVVATTQRTRLLAEPVPTILDEPLAARGVRFQRGQVMLACAAPDEVAVLSEVRAQELECQLVRNRGALMVLPPGVTKGSGLHRALGDLGVSHHNVVAVGDAENDHSLLDIAELGVAVSNAVDSLKARADVTLPGDTANGLASFLRGPVVSGNQRVPRRRWRVNLGTLADGQPVTISASQTNLLVTGATHGGKSHLSGLIAEQLIGLGYSLLVIDPEGDHVGLGQIPGVLVLGGAGRLPAPDELVRLVRHRYGSVVLDFTNVPVDERDAYLRAAPAEVEAVRHRTGLPHWVVLDEAHELLGGESVARAFLEPGGAGYCLVTHRPEDLPPEALLRVDVILAPGSGPEDGGLVDLIAAGGGMSHASSEALLASAAPGQAVLVDRRRPGSGLVFTIGARATAHVRHWHKYAVGRLPAERRFHFRLDCDTPAGSAAANLEEFERYLRSCDVQVIGHHGGGGDFSRWISDVLGDPLLGATVAGIEASLRDGLTSPNAARARLLGAIHQRHPATSDRSGEDHHTT